MSIDDNEDWAIRPPARDSLALDESGHRPARADRKLRKIDRLRFPALLNGRFQGDVINFVGVFAAALAVSGANDPAFEKKSLVLAIVTSIIVTLALAAGFKLWLSFRKEGDIGSKVKRNLVLVAVQSLALLCGWIAVFTGLVQSVYVALAVVVVLVGAQVFLQYGNTLLSIATARWMPVDASNSRRNAWFEALAGIGLSIGLSALWLSVFVTFGLELTSTSVGSGDVDVMGVVGASAWALIELVILITVIAEKDLPRRGFRPPWERSAPNRVEVSLACGRSVVIILAMGITIAVSANSFSSDAANANWLLGAMSVAAAATLLSIVLAIRHLYVKWRGDGYHDPGFEMTRLGESDKATSLPAVRSNDPRSQRFLERAEARRAAKRPGSRSSDPD